MKKDVGMAKRFSKSTETRDELQLPAILYVKMPVSAWCYIPTSLPQEQAAKTSMVSEVRIVFRIMYSWEVCC